MKMRKKITNAQLQTELVEILKNMFLPQKKMIKEQIEWLIEHKYIRRDESDINTFIYMAQPKDLLENAKKCALGVVWAEKKIQEDCAVKGLDLHYLNSCLTLPEDFILSVSLSFFQLA